MSHCKVCGTLTACDDYEYDRGFTHGTTLAVIACFVMYLVLKYA